MPFVSGTGFPACLPRRIFAPTFSERAFRYGRSKFAELYPTRILFLHDGGEALKHLLLPGSLLHERLGAWLESEDAFLLAGVADHDDRILVLPGRAHRVVGLDVEAHRIELEVSWLDR
jgi:hypothetical protein